MDVGSANHELEASARAASDRPFPALWCARLRRLAPEAAGDSRAAVAGEGRNVVLADRLDGEPLSLEHGAPFRLVVPDLYAYKSVKHVSTIRLRKDFRRGLADRQTLSHPRGRVALEERGRGLPGPIYRVLYRA